jgi:hypothetical protein
VADIVDLAMDTTSYFEPAVPSAPAEEAAKPDLRTKEGRAAAGLPPRARVPRGPAKVAGRRPAPKKQAVDYKAGVTSLFDLAAFGLQFTSPVDAATVSVYGPQIATAVNDLAQQKPELAKALDKILAAGPYGALIACVAPMVGQILANHGTLPVGMLGSVSQDEIMLAAMERAEQRARG